MSCASEAVGEALPNEDSPASPRDPLPLRADEEAKAGAAERVPGGAAVDGGAAELEAARFAYESTAEPVDSIAKRFAMSRWQLYEARRRGGWRMRSTGRPAQDSKADKIRELDRQLLSLTSELAGKLEDRVQAEGATDATMRGLTGLLRAREAMVESDRTDRGDKARDKKNKNNDGLAGHTGRAASGHAAGADRAPELRAKIAERLDRLRGSQGPGESSR